MWHLADVAVMFRLLRQTLLQQLTTTLCQSSVKECCHLICVHGVSQSQQATQRTTLVLLRQSFNSYHSIGKLNLNYQARVESLNKPDLVSLDEFYRNELLDTNSTALSTTSSTIATTTSATITHNLFHYLWTFYPLLKVNPFAKLTTDISLLAPPLGRMSFLASPVLTPSPRCRTLSN
ncbi:hypothetical protein Pint_20881 [Pistacia integerrima]|uniref:Uncharacterized protein n=1 Tax=Pistacia integerrima TaxID=434235 RepID=A0ACC0X9Q8_9ROSI|nr:hypothetical protein Pint_20881 [Pistacia integerrima]